MHLDLMMLFGFAESDMFSRDEFHYFLDCMFRGLLCLLIQVNEKMPLHRGSKLQDQDIAFLVD
jgi:hypothetical protein